MKLVHKVLATGTGVALALGIPAAAPAAAGEGNRSGAVELDATIDGRSLDDGSTAFRLDPDEPVELEVVVENGTDEAVAVRKVRIAGDTLGVAFFSFTTQVDVVVAAGATEVRTFAVDVSDLEGQATGLLDGRVEVVAEGGDVLASEAFVADALGSGTSTYSLFGMALALVTAVLLLGVVLGLRKGTLPANRFSRALRFAEPGAGLGLATTFTLSSLRIAVVPPAAGLAAIAIGTGVGFAIGFTLARTDDADADIEAATVLTLAG